MFLKIEQDLTLCLQESWQKISGLTELPLIPTFSHPQNEAFGDWMTNFSFEVFKNGFNLVEISNNPKELAAKLADLITAPFLTKVTSLNGFINFELSKTYLCQIAADILQNEGYSTQQILLAENQALPDYLVEFSSPNIAKPFTIGHLRSTIIGAAVANLLELIGAEVKKDNHLGDWGTQFGKLIWAIKKWGNLNQLAHSQQPVKDLVDLYVRFHQEAEKNHQIEDEARAWFKKMEDGDPEALELWQFSIEVSMKEFQRFYDILGVEFTENEGLGYGESFFSDKMDQVVEELRTKNLLQKSEGAELVFFDEADKLPPLMILRQDGATLYATRDLATDKFRLDNYGPELVILNEVGSEQELYFKQLFKLEEMLGWVHQPDQRKHIKHGLYRFKDRKMSTRKGDVIWLDDVLREAFERVAVIAKADDLSDEQIWKIALGALKWNDLSRESARDINFSWEEIVNLKGNSGPYMQYTFVRCLSILRKMLGRDDLEIEETLKLAREKFLAKNDLSGCLELQKESAEANEERLILGWIARYTEVVWLSAREYAPHQLANYLFELATKFNALYGGTAILGNEKREYLTLLTAMIIKQGLATLGIEVVDKM